MIEITRKETAEVEGEKPPMCVRVCARACVRRAEGTLKDDSPVSIPVCRSMQVMEGRGEERERVEGETPPMCVRVRARVCVLFSSETTIGCVAGSVYRKCGFRDLDMFPTVKPPFARVPRFLSDLLRRRITRVTARSALRAALETTWARRCAVFRAKKIQ